MHKQLGKIEVELREPSAKELVQRHQITSISSVPTVLFKRPTLLALKRGGSILSTLNQQILAVSFSLSRDCVLALHQNFQTNLLYGKNNVEMMSINRSQPLKGYLSLHQNNVTSNELILKWTPNMLMHSSFQTPTGLSSHITKQGSDKQITIINHVSTPPPVSCSGENWLWKYAINVCLNKIIYLHLHQQGKGEPAKIVLIDTEGVQHSSFQFATVQQCVSFLEALEVGLAPFNRLDPPLCYLHGKTLPKIQHKKNVCTLSSFYCTPKNTSNETINIELPSINLAPNGLDECVVLNEFASDYVFRIIPVTDKIDFSGVKKLFHYSFSGNAKPPYFLQKQINFSTKKYNSRVDMSDKKYNGNIEGLFHLNLVSNPQKNLNLNTNEYHKNSIKLGNVVLTSLSSARESMKQQIILRAFYGWLSYCRHLKTIRIHLATVVNEEIIQWEDADSPVDKEFWNLCRSEKTIALYSQLLVRTYLHGIEHSLRSSVWPYLLRLVDWHKDLDVERQSIFLKRYAKDVENWQAVETEVIKHDIEALKEARKRQNLACKSTSNDNTSSLHNGVNNRLMSVVKSFNSADSTFQIFMSENNFTEFSILKNFGKNLHRIEKDVERCDRNTLFYSSGKNLELLRRLMCTYVWRHLSDGYIQGMCDIAAPLLVIFNDEVLALECFEIIMGRLLKNFPHKNHGIENNLNNLRSLVQVMDPDLYYQVMNNSDDIHLYFAYRWFLLDFKREVTYDELFRVWETIWAAEKTVSRDFQLFFALALLTQYREVLIENNMDLTNVIKFFNEMAEKHNVDELLRISKKKLSSLQEIILDMTK